MAGMAGFECAHDVLVSRVVEQVGQKVGQTSQNQGYIHGIKMSIYRFNFILNIGINFTCFVSTCGIVIIYPTRINI